MEAPAAVVSHSFQAGWLQAVRLLSTSRWQMRNLVVHIQDPNDFDKDLHAAVSDFAARSNLRGPKHVAYTIFPHKLYARKHTAARLYRAYNRARGLYDFTRRRAPGWGTYFRRMTHYQAKNGFVNQLDRIIRAIRQAGATTRRAAYTIVIQHPGGETVRPRGGPCLNYVAVQLEPGVTREIGLLAVYRNHDFLERAYGNYWGLCNLIRFLAKETKSRPAALTCVSSRAYVCAKKRALKSFVEAL